MNDIIINTIISEFMSTLVAFVLVGWSLKFILRGFEETKCIRKIKTSKGERYQDTCNKIKTITGGILYPFIKTEKALERYEKRREYFMKGLRTIGSSTVLTPIANIFSKMTPLTNDLPIVTITGSIYLSFPVIAITAILTTIIGILYKLT